ncbi:FkbM family methyltransferase [Aureisphaera galaxeae]|uniref:FkbM family methyltransferase n=1 Tax=Aureisphaera galaxeae TaxID=1538023 RepID=UPI00234FE3BE|nr:FkbM family methyltransferase [Aureisphaera galaxeae]MDC8006307.1 FkbM family methyltransferase [Aureisphaera galaxeae]
MNRIYWVRFICAFFPPIMTQTIRDRLMSVREAEKMALPFRRRAFTGSYFQGNTSDFHAFKFLIHGYFDWRNVVLAKKIIRFKKGDLVEVGANIGTETIGLADLDPNRAVYAFEPLPSNFESLQQIKEHNGLGNLRLFNTLVSKERGEAFFKIPAQNSSGSGHITSDTNKETQRFEVVTLDDTLEDAKDVAAVIADVEGYEPQVLAGAETILKKYNPFLILEVNERFLRERGQTSVEEFYTYLEDRGYHCYYIERMGLKKVNAPHFETKTNKNWLCIPTEFHKKKSKLSRAIRHNALNPFIRYFVI